METNMSAMIDVVFQLLIFFMLTLKIVEPEGDFNINMPADGQPTQPSPDIQLPDLKVRITANDDGTLANLYFNSRSLGNDARVFERLNNEILRLMRPDDPTMEELEVEIDADYDLNFRNVINAVGACTGKKDPTTGKVTKYIENIKFKPPKKGGGAAAAG